MKRYLALLMAVIMMLSLGAMAFAEGADGSITVRNATIGQTYAAYRLFDLTYVDVPAQGTDPATTNVAYSYTKSSDDDTLFDALSADDSPFTLTQVNGTDTYNVTVKKDADVISFIKGLVTRDATGMITGVPGTPIGIAQEAKSDTVEFENLPYGYYIVTSSLGEQLISVDSTLKDVTIIDKNEVPSWDNSDTPGEPGPGKVIVLADGTKTIENSANYGDPVEFSIAVNAMAFNGDKQVKYYYIKDTLGAGFSNADTKNMTVTVTPQGKSSMSLAVETDYKFLTTPSENDNTFEIAIPYSAANYGAKSVIEVRYTANVLNTEDVVIAGSGNTNTADFDFDTYEDPYDPDDPDPDTPVTPPETPDYDQEKKITKTYVYAIGIQKVDEKGNPLAGATFSVNNGDKVIKAVATTKTGVYDYSSTAETAVSTFATDDKGVLIIKGLEAGKYTITEVTAPAGYNKLDGPVDVTAEIESTSEYTTTYYYKNGELVEKNDSDTEIKTFEFGVNVVPSVIKNSTGVELPSTGGLGTTLFIAIGAAVFAMTMVILVAKKRAYNAG